MPAIYQRNLGELASSFGLRATAKYQNPRFDSFNATLQTLPLVRLRFLCKKSIRRGVQPDYDKEGSVPVIKTMQLKNGHMDMSDALSVTDEFLSDYYRARVNPGNIVISSTGEGRGKIDVYTGDHTALADSHISVVPVQAIHDPLFIAYFLRTKFGRWQIQQTEVSVKATPELYIEDIGRLLVLRLEPKRLASLGKKIRGIEQAISSARAALRTPEDIINDILCREFRYPLKEHRERAAVRHFTRDFAVMAAGFSLRNSTRFHHPDFELTDEFFSRTPHERLKTFVAIPIKLGSTAAKQDFIEDGEAYYVHPGATKRQGVIQIEDCYQVSQAYYDENKKRSMLRSGDVVINRSGEALGKVAMFESEEQAVASDFTMRVRLNERISPRFAWYYFRSVMFQAQIEREWRGLSVPNIFPPQVQQMMVVSCKRARQDTIEEGITAELNVLAGTKASIESKGREIDALIEAEIQRARIKAP